MGILFAVPRNAPICQEVVAGWPARVPEALYVGDIHVIAVRGHGSGIPISGHKALQQAVGVLGIGQFNHRDGVVAPTGHKQILPIGTEGQSIGGAAVRECRVRPHQDGLLHRFCLYVNRGHGIGVGIGHIETGAILGQGERGGMQARGHLGRFDARCEVHQGNRTAGANTPAVNHHRCAGGSGREVPRQGQSATPIGDIGRVSVRRKHYVPGSDANVNLAADGAGREVNHS